MSSQDYDDVVTTRGAFLVPRGNTPVVERGYDAKFATDLCVRLDALVTVQAVRRAQYGDDAEQWPIGRTPPELVQKRKDEIEKLKAFFDAVESPSDSTTPNCAPSAHSPHKIEEHETRPGEPGAGAVTVNDSGKDRNNLAAFDRQEYVSQETGLLSQYSPAKESVLKVTERISPPQHTTTALSVQDLIAFSDAELAQRMEKHRDSNGGFVLPVTDGWHKLSKDERSHLAERLK